jgi:hypothetical protein
MTLRQQDFPDEKYGADRLRQEVHPTNHIPWHHLQRAKGTGDRKDIEKQRPALIGASKDEEPEEDSGPRHGTALSLPKKRRVPDPIILVALDALGIRQASFMTGSG